jgi:UDP:flavonoid glycosyltransferase YjiC (YdhE family)
VTAAVPSRPRVLFVSEAVTLAQVVRLATLARALDPARFEVHFAAARFSPMIFDGLNGAPPLCATRHTIESLSPEVIDARVLAGRRLYGRRTLAAYVREDRALLARVRPALVVGDLRLSLPIAAPLEGVPHAALVNAYWSPHAVRPEGWPLPDHPIVRLLGPRRAERHFPRALPLVMRHFAAPVNALRRTHGLPPLGDMSSVLTAGDHVLFPDVPSLVPTAGAPPHHRYLGYVPWSPPVALPPWWDALDRERATVYVTLGSSGRVTRLPLVVEAAASLGCQVLVSTAGRARLDTAALAREAAARVHVADYLPGDLAAARADVVVSNGGSTTGYQALAAGRPVLGVASNLDQYLATQAIARAGAGLLVRADTATIDDVRLALARLLSEPSFGAAARAASAALRAQDATASFLSFVGEATTRGVPRAAVAETPAPVERTDSLDRDRRRAR